MAETPQELRARLEREGKLAPVAGPAQSSLGALHGLPEEVLNAPVMLTPNRVGEGYATGMPLPGQQITVGQALAELFDISKFPPQRMIQLQNQLKAQGFLKADQVRFGEPDNTTYAAFQDAVIQAARSKRTLWDVMGMADERGFTADDSVWEKEQEQKFRPVEYDAPNNYATQLNTVNLTDADSIASAVEAAWVKAHGKKPSQAQKNAFVKTFQTMQQKPQQAQFAAQDRLTGEARGREEQNRLGEKAARDANMDAQINGTAPQADQAGKILAAIGDQESRGSGGYKAQSKTSTGSGKYQVLDRTWGNYAGYAHAKDAPPEVQERQAREMIEKKLKTYGGDVRKVVMSWFLPAAVNDAARADRVPKGNVITPNQYADQVMAKLGTASRYDPITGGFSQPVNSQTPVSPPIPVSETMNVITPDLGVEAEKYAETSDPASAVAHTAATTVFSNFLKILNGVGSQ